MRAPEARDEIVAIEDDIVTLQLEGSSRVVRKGQWAVAGFRDRRDQKPQEIGFEVAMRGSARFDRGQQCFVAFDLIARGRRWGGTQFNARGDDLEPSPIGVVFRLSDGQSRVAPALIWQYGWKR